MHHFRVFALLRLAALLLPLAATSPLLAQTAPQVAQAVTDDPAATTSDSGDRSPNSSPQSSDSPRPARPHAVSLGTPDGPGRYVAGKWGTVRAVLGNPTGEDVELIVSSYLGEDKSLQFGRRMWVPAGSVRISQYPVLVPSVSDRGQDRIRIGSLVQDAGADPRGSETIHSKPDGKLILDQGRAVTGLLSGFRGPPTETDWSYEAALAVRACQQQNRQLAILEPRTLPDTPEAIDALDHLVLADEGIAEHPAALRAIRTWLFRGGRLWIMLDHVGEEASRRLLGDALEVAVIDEVGLNTVTVENVNPSPHEKIETTEFEEPVGLVRVVVSRGEVTHTVEGWPAAFWLDVGRGRVLVTTLGARGWLRRRGGDDPPPRSELHYTDYYPRLPLEQLAGVFLVPEETQALPAEQVVPYLSERIGYRTLPRPWLVAILGGFCLTVLGGAVWFARRGRPERLAPATAAAALAVTALIVGLGWSTRSAVPPSIAGFALVQALPDPHQLHVQGQLGLYNPSVLDEPLGVERGGILWPDMTGFSGQTRRMMFTDLESYRWQNLQLPPGVRLADVRLTVQHAGPLSATGRLTERGVAGTLRAPGFSGLEDALLATPSGRVIAVRLAEDGSFTADAGAVLDRGQVMAESLLSDEQRRRRAIYSHLLAPGTAATVDSSRKLIQGPTLLAWSDPIDLPLTLPENSQQLGAHLLVVPLTMRPAEPGSLVRIPSPLLAMRSVTGPQGQTLSSSYNNRNRQWLPQTTPSELHLEFSVPPAALPLDVQGATLQLKLHCPTRTVEVVGFADRQPVVLARYESPQRVVSLAIRRPEVLQLDAGGSLLLGVYVDRGATTDNEAEWRIEDAQLELTGRVREN